MRLLLPSHCSPEDAQCHPEGIRYRCLLPHVRGYAVTQMKIKVLMITNHLIQRDPLEV